jgi:hypothetical protein
MSRTPPGAPVRTNRGGAGTSSWTTLTRVSGRVCLVSVVGVAFLGALAVRR